MHTYAWIKLFLRFGKPLAFAMAVACPLIAFWGVIGFGLPWIVLALGIVAGLLVGFFIMVFAELTHVIAEMLLPH
jgi:hypothetical protein